MAFDPSSRFLSSAVILSETAAGVYASSRRQFGLYRRFFYPSDLIQQACLRVPINLTHTEWKEYIPNEPYRKTCAMAPVPVE